MPVDRLADVMNYYGWCFAGYILAAAVVLIGALKSLRAYRMQRSAEPLRASGRLDLLVSVLCGLVLAGGEFFQGVLADNNAPGLSNWSGALLAICIVAAVLFVVQLVFYWKTYPADGC